MRYFFIFSVFGLMVFAIFYAPDRSVALATSLLKNKDLYQISKVEMKNLDSVLDGLIQLAEIKKNVAVNEPYDPNKVNIYVIDKDEETQDTLLHGNAGYAKRSDILFIDSSYFHFGDQRVFEDAKDKLTQSVMAPIRVYTIFILAHELGHRQNTDGFLSFAGFGSTYSYERERKADEFAVKLLIGLYQDNLRTQTAGIPKPISGLIGFSGETTALQYLVDHLSYSVALFSEDIFENPFPILSQSSSHPAYFSRMIDLLRLLKISGEAAGDNEALRQLNFANDIASATTYLMSLRPTELEYAGGFQYAFMGNETLYVISNDVEEIDALPLKDIAAGKLIFTQGRVPVQTGAVRYAWIGSTGKLLSLGRDGQLRLRDPNSRKTLTSVSTRGKFGDNSCVRRFIIPPQPAETAMVYHCIAGEDRVTTISSEGNFGVVKLMPLAMDALGPMLHDKSELQKMIFAGFDLDAGGNPVLYVKTSEQVFSVLLDQEFKIRDTKLLALPAAKLPADHDYRGAKIVRRVFFADENGRSYYLVGADIAREFGLFTADTNETAPIATIDLSSTANMEELYTEMIIRDSYQLNGNRLILNLESGGAYLIDFSARQIAPLNRRGFSKSEQIVSNTSGDWLLYRKYGDRILLFKGHSND